MSAPVVRPTSAAILAAVLMQALAASSLAPPATAQEGDGAAEEEAARAASIARADSVRAALVQPPGHRGVTAEDVIRVPFRLLGAAIAVAALPPLALYAAVTETGLDERAMDAYRRLQARDVHPRVDFIGSRSWPALVVRYEGLDPLFLEGGASLRGYTLARAGLAFGDTARGAELVGTHHRMTQLHTWSLGMDAPAEPRFDYARTRRMAEVAGWARLTPWALVRVDAAREEDDVSRGADTGRPDLHGAPFADDLFGLDGASYWRAGAALDLDWTGARSLQMAGFRALGRYDVLRGADGTDSDFQRAQADLRLYVPFTGRHMLALRGLAEDRFAERGEGVPFHRLAMLGDDHGLRGYSSRRFRDQALLAATVEWRYEIWFHPGDAQYRVEGFAFADQGGVGPSLAHIEGFETTPGLGIRFVEEGVSWIEGYVAWGGDRSPRFDVELGATF